MKKFLTKQKLSIATIIIFLFIIFFSVYTSLNFKEGMPQNKDFSIKDLKQKLENQINIFNKNIKNLDNFTTTLKEINLD